MLCESNERQCVPQSSLANTSSIDKVGERQRRNGSRNAQRRDALFQLSSSMLDSVLPLVLEHRSGDGGDVGERPGLFSRCISECQAKGSGQGRGQKEGKGTYLSVRVRVRATHHRALVLEAARSEKGKSLPPSLESGREGKRTSECT